MRSDVRSSDGSGSKFFDPGRVNLLWLGSGRVSHLWFGVDFGKFLLKTSNFSLSDQKVLGSRAGQPLIYCRSKESSGRVMAHL